MNDNNEKNNTRDGLKDYSYQPSEQRSYQPTNNGKKTPEPPKVKSAEK